MCLLDKWVLDHQMSKSSVSQPVAELTFVSPKHELMFNSKWFKPFKLVAAFQIPRISPFYIENVMDYFDSPPCDNKWKCCLAGANF